MWVTEKGLWYSIKSKRPARPWTTALGKDLYKQSILHAIFVYIYTKACYLTLTLKYPLLAPKQLRPCSPPCLKAGEVKGLDKDLAGSSRKITSNGPKSFTSFQLQKWLQPLLVMYWLHKNVFQDTQTYLRTLGHSPLGTKFLHMWTLGFL